jgi:Tfp pilus assembly protein PilO
LTQQNKLTILAVYLLILALSLPLYRLKRNATDKRLQAEINTTKVELAKINTATIEMNRLHRLFPPEAHTTSFIEDLYTAAQQAKLTTHEVSSENTATRPSSRVASQADELSRFRFKVDVEGSFRSIAEYIRIVQNIERFKHVSAIQLAPGKKGVMGTISLELFSLKGQNAR